MRSYQNALKELQRENFELKLLIYDLKKFDHNQLPHDKKPIDSYINDELDDDCLQEIPKLSHDQLTQTDSFFKTECNTHDTHTELYYTVGSDYAVRIDFDEKSRQKLLILMGLVAFLEDQLNELSCMRLYSQIHYANQYIYYNNKNIFGITQMEKSFKSIIINIATKVKEIAYQLYELSYQRNYVLERDGNYYTIEL